MSRIEKDATPQNRAELCACISILAECGRLTPDDHAFVIEWLLFRQNKVRT